VDEQTRRSRYEALRRTAPDAFQNPPDAPVEVLLDPDEIRAAEETVAQQLTAAGKPASWAQTGVVFEDQYLVVVRDAVRTPSGRFGTYLRTIDFDAAGVVVLPRLGEEVVLIRHFRHSTRRWHYEVPRGFGSAGSTPEEDARRELQEEIGVVPRALTTLGVVRPDTGMTAGAVHLFHADLDGSPEMLDTEEGITATKLVAPLELGRMIRDGEIDDGFTMAAFLRASLLGLL
jgi:ADP-ribose pyrophosphatase